MLLFIRLQLFKLYTNLIIFADGASPMPERLEAVGRTLIVFAPFAYALELLGVWFDDNQKFTLFVAGFITGNAIIGMIVHKLKNEFSWEELLVKTLKMVGITCVTYITLEGLVSPLGDNAVTDGIVATFQLATLLYPGSKILKNIFIWSDGEHPPKWIMQKIYNFNENGDLKEFLNNDDPKRTGGRNNRYKAEDYD